MANQTNIDIYQNLVNAFNQEANDPSLSPSVRAQAALNASIYSQEINNMLSQESVAPAEIPEISQANQLAANAIAEKSLNQTNNLFNAFLSGRITEPEFNSLRASLQNEIDADYANLNSISQTNNPEDILSFAEQVSTQPIQTPIPGPVVRPTTDTATSPVAPGTAISTTPGVTPGTTPGFTPSPLAASTSNFLSNIPQLVQAPTVSPLLQNLPELRGGAAGESSIDPTLRPYLETGLQAAEQLYLRQTPQLYPGQMYVSPSAQTLDALTQQEQIARAQPSALQAAQESYMQGLGGLSATAQGAFLMGNPYLQSAIQSATRPIQQQFAETTLPGIASQYSRAGRYGSGAMARSLGQATEATGRALGDVSANIAYQGYEAERGRQQQAMGGQISAAQMAPNIYGQQFLPSQQLAQIGAAQEALAAQPLQEAMQRYQYSQQIPYQQLQGFLSSVYGTPMAGSQYAPAAQPNTAGNVLGGLAAGAGVGNLFRQAGVESIFGMNPVTAGSIFGTAAGLLF